MCCELFLFLLVDIFLLLLFFSSSSSLYLLALIECDGDVSCRNRNATIGSKLNVLTEKKKKRKEKHFSNHAHNNKTCDIHLSICGGASFESVRSFENVSTGIEQDRLTIATTETKFTLVDGDDLIVTEGDQFISDMHFLQKGGSGA